WAHEPLFGYVNFRTKDRSSVPLFTSTEFLHRLELLNGVWHANFRLINALVPYGMILFRNGIETFVKALEADLKKKNVRIVKGREIASLTPNDLTDNITVCSF